MTVGAKLAQARGERKLSYAEVTRETKIQPWVLEALEGDRLQELMSPIYVKGFLATYAKFLHLEAEPLLTQLSWPAPEPKPAELPPSATPDAPPEFSWPQWHVSRRLLAGVAVSAAVLGLVALHPVRWVKGLRFPSHGQARVAKAMNAPKTHGKSAEKSPAKPVAQANESKGQVASAPKPASPPASAPAPEPAKPVEPPAVSLASLAPIAEPLKPEPPPSLTLVASQPLELALTATRSTWVRIKADGKLLIQQRLPRGASERWVAKKQFEVIISKPAEVELVLNGQSISPFAIAHQGKLRITHRGVTELAESR